MLRKLVIAVVVAVTGAIAVLVFLLDRRAAPVPSQPPVVEAASEGQDITLLMDLSASFAPYGERDRIALKHVSEAITELARRHWSRPITIIWRPIGQASGTAPSPVCNVIEYASTMLNAATADAALDKQMLDCLDSVRQQSKRPEKYTDISGAVVRAVYARQTSQARKTLLIFSDFKEDQPGGSAPMDIQLRGETVVMVHRPGTDESDVPAYLDRIRRWADVFKSRGATAVLDIPLDLMTRHDLLRLLQPAVRETGTAATVLADLKDTFNRGRDLNDGDSKHLKVLGHAVAQLAREWAPPTTVRMGIVRPSALRMQWMEASVFDPKIIPRPGQMNTVQDLMIDLQTQVLGLRNASPATAADLSGAIALAESGSQTAGQTRYLFLVSDFVNAGGVPSELSSRLRGARVVLVYRPSSLDSNKQSGFFERLETWKKLFVRAGAVSACGIEMTGLTEHSVRECLGMKPVR